MVKVRVVDTVLFAVSNGKENAEESLRARLEGDDLVAAAAKGGIGVNKLRRMEDLYRRAISKLEKRRDAGASPLEGRKCT